MASDFHADDPWSSRGFPRDGAAFDRGWAEAYVGFETNAERLSDRVPVLEGERLNLTGRINTGTGKLDVTLFHVKHARFCRHTTRPNPRPTRARQG